VIQYNHYNTVENLPTLPLWFDYIRSFGKPFWNTETATGWNGSTEITQVAKPVGFCRINSWLPVALGGEANLYWLWRQHWGGHELMHGSVIYANGRPLPMFDEVQQISREFELAKDFLRETKVDTKLAMHFTSLSWRINEVQPMIDKFLYISRLAEDFHVPVTRMGLRPDMIDTGKDLSGYKVLVSPMVYSLEEKDLPRRIEEWVRDGGHWVVGPMTDIRNAIGAHYTDRAMGYVEEMTGCRLVATIPDSGVVVKSKWADGEPMSAHYMQQVFTPAENGRVLASVTEGYASIIGTALVQKVPCGKGAIWLLGTLPDSKDLQKLMAMVCAEAGIEVPEVTGTVTVIPRSGENRQGLILMETACAPASYRLPEPMTDLLTGTTYAGTVELKPYDLMILEPKI
jgi:beta-galactosidase GanA